MKNILTYLVPAAAAALIVAVGVLEGACNNVGDCPTAPITPGDKCTGDNLQCPYTLDTPSPACDGTMVEGGIATSCICTDGTWACPDPISCDTGDGGGDETTPTDDGAADTGADAPDDTGADAPDDTGADATTD